MWSARIVPAHFWIREYTVHGIGISTECVFSARWVAPMLMKRPLSSFPGRKYHTERRSQPPEVADFVNLLVVVSLGKPIEVHLTPNSEWRYRSEKCPE